MDKFYQALPYALIFAQTFGAALLARRYSRSRSVRSKWILALVAALPLPALLVGLSAFAFKGIVSGSEAGCSVDGCASDRSAFTTLMFSALTLYLIGLVTALMGYRSGKASFERRRSE